MKARVLIAGLVVISTMLTAESASAKVSIAGARISGPGLGGVMRIKAPDTEGLWEAGIDFRSGMDDTRADSVRELGLTRADLGSRYVATYRFEFSDDPIRQDLYPYARGGPVTYTPRGQQLAGLFGDAGDMPITAGWYQSSPGFLRYLMDKGLPERSPVARVATGETATPGSGVQTAPWQAIVVVVARLTTLLLATLTAPPPRTAALGLGRTGTEEIDDNRRSRAGLR
jgi:hypothetical protein